MFSGLSGEEQRALGLAWACAMGVAAIVICINILGRIQEDPTELVVAFVDELTSLAALAVAFLVPGIIASWMWAKRRGTVASAAALAVGLMGFAVFHIGICAGLRTLVYPAIVGETYGFHFMGREGPFEFGKDIIAFATSVTGFIAILAWRLRPAPVVASGHTSTATFDIQDGSKLVRVAVDDILAVQSAGNYAEFLLSDGRRPLMRISLSGLEMELAPRGFVRTHRSWLVNRARVTGLSPEGSSDFTVELGEVSAPVSRRYPTALAALRAN